MLTVLNFRYLGWEKKDDGFYSTVQHLCFRFDDSEIGSLSISRKVVELLSRKSLERSVWFRINM